MKTQICIGSVFAYCAMMSGVANAENGSAANSGAANQTGSTPSTTPSGKVESIGSSNNAVQDIVVTANKRSESVNKVPLSITAVSGSTLTSLGVKDVSDLTKVVPGFVAIQGQVGAGRSYFLRGVGYYTYNLSGRPTVTLYQDEMPLPYSPMAVGADLDLERVEVLKGPQGTLFGSNSTGGAINFIAARPTDHFSFGADASYGRFNENDLSGFVSGPLSDAIRVRLALSHEGRGDWQQNYTNNDKLGEKDISSGRLTIDANPTDRLTATLTLSGDVDHSDTQAGQLVDKTGALPVLASQPLAPPGDARAANWDSVLPYGHANKNNNYQYRAALRLDYELTDDVKLTSLTSYIYNRERFGQDTDGSQAKITDYYVDGHLETFAQELRAAGSVGHGRWIVGANYESSHTLENQTDAGQDGAGSQSFNKLGLPPVDLSLAYGRTHDTSKALFGNLDYDIANIVTLHGGVRYTKTDTRFVGCSIAEGNDTLGIALAETFKLTPRVVGQCIDLGEVNGTTQFVGYSNLKLPEHNVSFRAGIDIKPRDGTLLYGTVSRGYKAGQFANIGGAFADRFDPVPQERLTDYEIGIKSAVVPGLLQVNGALFYYDYANKQLQGRKQVPFFGFLQALISVPKSRVEGAEIEATLRPLRGLSLNAAATYVSTKIQGNFVSFTQFGVQQNFDGLGFPFTPHWQANGSAEYRWPVSDTLDAFFGTNVTYRSKSYGDFVKNPILAINAYALLDARVGIESHDHRWTMQLFGRNITDKYYWTSVVRAQQATYRFAGLPATYGVSASFRF